MAESGRHSRGVEGEERPTVEVQRPTFEQHTWAQIKFNLLKVFLTKKKERKRRNPHLNITISSGVQT